MAVGLAEEVEIEAELQKGEETKKDKKEPTEQKEK